MNMVTRTSLVCFLAMSMMIFDGTLGRSTRQLRSTSCDNDGDCGYEDFCHYKFKKCRPCKLFLSVIILHLLIG